MIIEEVPKEKYSQIVSHGYIFNSVEFNELNRYKVESLKYLLFKDNKYRFGLCVGIQEGRVLCPFSAPFASMVSIKKPVSIITYDQAVESLNIYMDEQGYKSIKFILPPMFYDVKGITTFINVLYRKGYEIENIDLNYQFDLKKASKDTYPQALPRNGRKNLRISLTSDLQIKRCTTYEENRRAYSIIAENRESKGYPLKMTFQQVMDTVGIVDHDFLMVMKEEESIAAALVYHISDNVAQVIYWGDRPGFGQLKPINYLAYQLIHYYDKRGFNYLDIGPSTEKSIPNYGLCDFKESIGCDISTKMSMIKMLGK